MWTEQAEQADSGSAWVRPISLLQHSLEESEEFGWEVGGCSHGGTPLSNHGRCGEVELEGTQRQSRLQNWVTLHNPSPQPFIHKSPERHGSQSE